MHRPYAGQKAIKSAIFIRDKLIRPLAVTGLFFILAANLLFLVANLDNRVDLSCTALYGLNVLTGAALLGIAALQALFDFEEWPIIHLLTSFLVACAGTSIGCVLICAVVITFGRSSTTSGPVALVSCLALALAFVFYVYLRDHS